MLFLYGIFISYGLDNAWWQKLACFNASLRFNNNVKRKRVFNRIKVYEDGGTQSELKHLVSRFIRLRPIGRVRCDFSEEEIKKKRGSIVSEVVIDPPYVAALDGVESYSHLFVIFYMHKVPLKETRALKVHPRGRKDVKKVGIFATRSRNRPNPIGLAVVELLQKHGNSLKVRALDALDGTPVLDIKPYDPIDAQKNVRVPKWWYKIRSSF